MDTQYFKTREFDSPDEKGSGKMMDENFMKKLLQARILADVAFIVNSAYRTTSHNKKVGGKPNSSHTFGLAVDLKATDSRTRYRILEALIKVGFHRIGIAKTFIHVDDDPLKDPAVTWLY